MCCFNWFQTGEGGAPRRRNLSTIFFFFIPLLIISTNNNSIEVINLHNYYTIYNILLLVVMVLLRTFIKYLIIDRRNDGNKNKDLTEFEKCFDLYNSMKVITVK